MSPENMRATGKVLRQAQLTAEVGRDMSISVLQLWRVAGKCNEVPVEAPVLKAQHEDFSGRRWDIEYTSFDVVRPGSTL